MVSPYLEPIDENDLDTKQQFTGSVETSKKAVETGTPKNQPEASAKIEKEIPQEVAKAEKDSSYNKILSKVKTKPQVQPSDDDIKTDAQKMSEKIDPESRIINLVDLAMNKGVIHAVKVAQHLDDNYVLDMFHDKLMSDELHDALIKKGLIKEA